MLFFSKIDYLCIIIQIVTFKIIIMESDEQVTGMQHQLEFNEEIRRYLDFTTRWGKFLAILGFIGTGFIFLAGIIFLTFGSTMNEFSSTPEFPPFVNPLVGVIYLLMAVLYFFPCLYLFNFSNEVSKGLEMDNQEAFNFGFRNLKSLFKFMGIVSIVCIGLFIIMFIIIFIGALFAGI